ncbi:glycosyltransferase family 4 protein [Fulvivirgaceae bacterium PWU4]|uniref:Glycosyltransferase family 4 protein n=1 Tax=Chryseosolibacter histidini TaxID=2782349 RepID=A0AAP2DTW4_9BACT|nr:glycosyltransferase family 4 protein [Chryseosolibacter histidini]MBT1700514.1 glycosyltransferase family 4 protein [Chryseosolibacter histidini]
MSDQIVFINQNSGYLMIDIINAHRGKYKTRAFITGKLTARNVPLDSDVKVEKIVTYNRTTTIKRLWTWGWAFVQILFLVKTKYRKADLYIVSNPPFAPLLPLFCSNRFFILTYDVYPDALVEYKIMKADSFVIRLWKRANRKIFARAAKLFTLSEGMKTLLSQYADASKIEVAPLWTDNTFLKPVDKHENKFIAANGLQGKFLVMYSGNLGFTHNLEMLVEAAARLRNNQVQFVIIGEGDKKKMLEERIASYGLTNCLMLPWQDVQMLPYSLSAADLAVVTLGKEASLLSVPSKTYNLMSVGAPMLCLASKHSELAALIAKYGMGRCFEDTELDAMVAFIEEIAARPDYQRKLHTNALAASTEFGPENAHKLIAVS